MPEQENTVLLIEDNEDNRIVYSTILQHYGYAVLEAQTGEEGLELARTRKPGVILMDIGLPGMDGWETTTRLRRDEATRDIPVIALTAHALSEHRMRALEVGCDDFLAKPVEPREVLAAVTRHLDASARARYGRERISPTGQSDSRGL
jgi:two-component system, cell cycle response regulator DivK